MLGKHRWQARRKVRNALQVAVMRLKAARNQVTSLPEVTVVVKNHGLPGKKAADRLWERFRRVREWLAA